MLLAVAGKILHDVQADMHKVPTITPDSILTPIYRTAHAHTHNPKLKTQLTYTHKAIHVQFTYTNGPYTCAAYPHIDRTCAAYL
jgi:hypothetical protein